MHEVSSEYYRGDLIFIVYAQDFSHAFGVIKVDRIKQNHRSQRQAVPYEVDPDSRSRKYPDVL